ncbi:MAG: ABC transporter ATP-binding protein [Verrucomicrobiota bacterium]
MKPKEILVLKDLNKSFRLLWKRKRLLAVRDLSLTVQRGEIYGLLGPNGSGKSTTMKLILGLLRPDSGKIQIDGHAAGSMPARKKIGFLPENPYFPQFLTAREILHYYGSLCGLRGKKLNQRSEELLELVGLQDADNRPLRVFSKGMLQRIGLAQAMIHEPEILLLDEPTSGVDPMGSRQMRDLILNLKEKGKTIIFSSHLLDQVQEIVDHVAILHLGKKLCEGSLEKLLTIPDEVSMRLKYVSPEKKKELLSWLAQQNFDSVHIASAHWNLEEFFLNVIHGSVAE